MKILIADDDPIYRELMGGLLSGWSFDVVQADDGAQAMRLLREDPTVRLALLDWMMPEMDGYEVCRRLRAQSEYDDLYVVMVTGTRDRNQILQVILAGADDYLIKPFDPMDLKIRIRNAIRLINLQDELRQKAQPTA